MDNQKAVLRHITERSLDIYGEIIIKHGKPVFCSNLGIIFYNVDVKEIEKIK